MSALQDLTMMNHFRCSVALSILILLVQTLSVKSQDASTEEGHGAPQGSCLYTWTGGPPQCAWEPHLRAMSVPNYYAGVSGEKETFYAYVTPDVSTFYNATPGTLKPAKDAPFTSVFVKFINMSPDPIRVYWQEKANHDASKWGYISDVEPFGSAGTAGYERHRFVVTPKATTSKELTTWVVDKDNSLYYYDPFNFDAYKAKKVLTDQQYHMYFLQWQNRQFAILYRQFTGRDWLALYKQKQPPRFHMWRADYIGQTHSVISQENHFVQLPSHSELARGTSAYGPRPDERGRMRMHRHRDPNLELHLTALSCAPRVFQIDNFLSDVEVQHLLHLGGEAGMKRSTTRASSDSEATTTDRTRTSRNAWVSRASDLVVDAIYRRAADVLHMDEALLRWRRATEIPEMKDESAVSVAERLQLVHYNVGEQYTPHHDFSMPSLVHLQPSRFATLLIYLNEGMKGGETSFPRWLHAEKDGGALEVTPKAGMAVLFYNLLPDGNYDERSLHAALPVAEGEKWLTNLWVWDPILDHRSSKSSGHLHDEL